MAALGGISRQPISLSPATTWPSMTMPLRWQGLNPDFAALGRLDRAVLVTAPGGDVDFVSRFFAPGHGIPEDPVTGSTHCTLTPYWAERLGKTVLSARQISRRGGRLKLKLARTGS